MQKALELAKQGEGHVNPNPMVGAVIVKDGEILSTGYHKQFGKRHAERIAIEDAPTSVEGATLYVTLEPCCHVGKTPACTDIILQSGIKTVVVAMQDPNTLVSGKGNQILREHGVEVIVGVLEHEAKALNEIFCKFITKRNPFVTYKYAMTLDGKIATPNGASQWISSEASRNYVQHLRNKHMAIMVGVNTVLSDNPRLNPRIPNPSTSIKIIVDSLGKTPLDSNIFTSPGEVIIAATYQIEPQTEEALIQHGATVIKTTAVDGQVNLAELLEALHKRQIDSILLEGGKTLAGSMLTLGLIDKIEAFVCPKIIGEGLSPVGGFSLTDIADSISYSIKDVKTIGQDVLLTAYKETLCLQD